MRRPPAPQSASRPTGWPRAWWRHGRRCWKKPPSGHLYSLRRDAKRVPDSMSGLLRRIRRPGAAEETRTEPIALPEPAHGSAPTAPDGTPPSARMGGPCPPASLPRTSSSAPAPAAAARCAAARASCAAPASSPCATSAASSTRRTGASRTASALVEGEGRSTSRCSTRSCAALETELGTPRGETVLREPGVGGTCPRCGELHASDARFCSSCGLDLTAAAPAAAGEAAAPEAAERPATRGARPKRRRTARRPRSAGRPSGAPTTRSRGDGAAEPAGARRAAKRRHRRPSGHAEQPTADTARPQRPKRGRADGETPNARMTEVATPPPAHRAGVPSLRRVARARPGVVPELRDRGGHADRADAALAGPRRPRRARCSR